MLFSGEVSLEKLGVHNNIAQPLTKLVLERLKPQKVHLAGTLELSLTVPDGVEILKKTLMQMQKEAAINYVAAGKYRVTVEDTDYKLAEKKLSDLSSTAITTIEKQGGKGVFQR